MRFKECADRFYAVRTEKEVEGYHGKLYEYPNRPNAQLLPVVSVALRMWWRNSGIKESLEIASGIRALRGCFKKYGDVSFEKVEKARTEMELIEPYLMKFIEFVGENEIKMEGE